MIVHALALAAVLSLGRAESFSILGGSGVTASGPMRVTGNVGAGSGGVTGVSPVVGDVLPGGDALKDVASAWDNMQRCSPPVHCLSSITYVFNGGADDVWIIQIDGDLIIPPGSSMKLLGGAKSSNVFWRVNGSATLGERSSFVGTLIALSNITVREGVTVSGRLIARQGTVTLTTDDVNFCCHPIEQSDLPNGIANVQYSKTIIPSGGTWPYTFSLFSGMLPLGLDPLGPTGTLSGVPAAGSYTFIVLVQDYKGCTSIHTYTIVICGTATLEPSTLPDAVVGCAYNVPITTSEQGMHVFTTTPLPDEMFLTPASCESAALLSGTPKAPGTNTFTITATDCDGICSGSREYTLKVVCPVITLCPLTLDPGTVGTLYKKTITVCEAKRSYTFVATPPIVIPTGVLSFIPATRGPYFVKVTATDEYGCTGMREYTIYADCGESPLPDSLPDAALNMPYTVLFNDAYTYSFKKLPEWLIPTGPRLSGTPPLCGDFTFTVTATDPVSGCSWCRTYTLHVPCCPEITIAPAALPHGTVSVMYNKMISVTGGAPPYVITVTGAFPPGITTPPALFPPLTFSGSTMTLSGPPTMPGSYTFTVTATDSQGCFAEHVYTIVIRPPLVPGPVIPTLSEWMLLMLAIVLGCAGFVVGRRTS